MRERQHNPRHKYDCNRCKYHWNCGPLSGCGLNDAPPPPRRRALAVIGQLVAWRYSRGYAPTMGKDEMKELGFT